MRTSIIYMIWASVFLSSCHIYKAYDRPADIVADGLYRDPFSMTDTLAADADNLGDVPWRDLFKDTQLQLLIQQGLDNNVNLQAAYLRVEEAKNLLTAARLSFLPALNLAPQGTITSLESRSAKAYMLPVAASWEIDLFGKLLNAGRGAQASLLKSEAYAQAVRSQLIAGIANAYYTLLMLDRQVAISEETAKLWKENVRTMVALKEAGMTNELAVSRSKANSHQVEAALADLRRQVRETENALSVLLAEPPHHIERGRLEEQELPEQLAAGVPLQLLANRPDVRAAEMALAGAYYTTNQARSAFYPSLTIGGNAGWTNGSGLSVANPGHFMAQALASLAQPIFSRGKLIANLKVSKAEEEIAKMNYQQSLLNAGKEVSNALYLYEAASQKGQEHRMQTQVLSEAVDYTQELFRSGGATYLEVLTAQQSLLSARLNEVADTFQRMQAVINLYEALGGGRE